MGFPRLFKVMAKLVDITRWECELTMPFLSVRAGLDDLHLPALTSAEEDRALQSLHAEVQQLFSDNILHIEREIFQSVRLGKSLGRHPGCRPVPGSGWMVCYKKDLEPLTTADVEPLIMEGTPGVIYLRVVGGEYGDRIHLDFTFWSALLRQSMGKKSRNGTDSVCGSCLGLIITRSL
jgi:hypothetical protein